MQAQDSVLLAQWQRGDHEAAKELLARYTDTMGALAQAIVRDLNLAEEVVQLAADEANKTIRQLHDDSALVPWLLDISRNIAYEVVNSQVRRNQRGVFNVMDHDGIDRNPEQAKLHHNLRLAVDGLSEEHRIIFLMHTMAGMTYQNIAQALQLTVQEIRQAMFGLRRQLEDALELSVTTPCGGETLSAFVDGELSDEEAQALKTHLAQCDACTKTKARLRWLHATARETFPRTLFAATITPVKRKSVSKVAAALLIGMLLGALLLTLVPRPTAPSEQPRNVVNPPAPQQVAETTPIDARSFENVAPREPLIELPERPVEQLTGRVHRPDGNPIEGARIGAFARDDAVNEVLSDRNGDFTLTFPKTTTQFLVYASGYTIAGVLYKNRLTDLALEMEVTLFPAATVSGNVVNSDGFPVAGVRVLGYFAAHYGVGPETVTDGTGYYEIDRAVDHSALFFLHPDYAVTRVGIVRADLYPQVILSTGGQLTITCLDDAEFLSGDTAELVPTQELDVTVHQAKLDANGTAVFPLLTKRERYALRIRNANGEIIGQAGPLAPFLPGEDVREEQIDINPVALVPENMSEAAPLPEVWPITVVDGQNEPVIYLEMRNAVFVPAPHTIGAVRMLAHLNDTGTLGWTGDKPRQLFFYAPMSNETGVYRGVSPCPLDSPAVSLRGLALNADKLPLPGYFVRVQNANDTWFRQTNKRGVFEIDGLPAGEELHITGMPPDLSRWLSFIPSDLTVSQNEPVTRFIAEEQNVLIVGVVHDETGRPIGGLEVTAVTDSSGLPYVETTDDSGNFIFKVPPNVYAVSAEQTETQEVDTRLENPAILELEWQKEEELPISDDEAPNNVPEVEDAAEKPPV